MTVSAKRPRICFVALNGYTALSGRTDERHTGGAEVQQSLIARELSGRGYQVSFVVLDHGQRDGEIISGVTVHTAYRPQAGLPGIRFVHPRWTRLCAALDRANADVYYQRTAASETGQCAWWCRRHGRRFIFAAASQSDCDSRLPHIRSRRERILYRYGLTHAWRVVAQTQTQVALFNQEFGIDAILIRSCSRDPLNVAAFVPQLRPHGRQHLLWVGRFSPRKRFEYLLAMAAESPEFNFDVVADTQVNSEYGSELIAKASRLPNILLHGYVVHSEIGKFYDRAALSLCTSPVEGFPNTMLEAWSRGVPTVSTFDPDGVIQAHGLGAVAGDVSGLRAGAFSVTGSAKEWLACSGRARRYYYEEHRVEAAIDRYESLLAGQAALPIDVA